LRQTAISSISSAVRVSRLAASAPPVSFHGFTRLTYLARDGDVRVERLDQ